MAVKTRGKAAPAPRKARKRKQPSGAPPVDDSGEKFAAEYLIDFNASRAYRAVFPHVTDGTSRVQGCRMLADPNIQVLIAAAAKRTAEAYDLTKDRVYRETARIAFFDPRKMFGPDGRPLQITELDADTAGAIAGLEVLEEHEGQGEERRLVGHVKKYKIADKNVALERAAKLLALFKDDNAQRVDPLIAMFERMGRSSFPVVANPGNDDGK